MSGPRARTRCDHDLLAIAEGLDRLFLWSRRGAPVHVSSTSITTLDSLEYGGPRRITDLAEREGVSQPGMTTLVNRLVRDGYAERVPDPADGRVARVRITDVGRRALAERHAERSAALRSIIAKLPAEHQASLGAALDALRALTETTTAYPETSDS